MAELDKRIEGILLQRLTHIIQVWCTEFDRTDDGDTRRDPLPLRDITNKRRGDKRMKEEKVRCGVRVQAGVRCVLTSETVVRGQYDAQADRA